jgi:hypothetical protein
MAISFLVILSILGAVVMRVSTEGLKASSATIPSQRALYAADRTVEYAMNRDIIINLVVSGAINLADNTEVKDANGTNVAGVYHNTIIDGSGDGSIISGTVTDKGPRTLPPHMAAMHGSEFGANLYHVNAKTTSSNASPGSFDRETHVDASIVRLFKMDDDQIFRTSGGG